MATKTAGKGITVDDDFLRKFLEKGGQAATQGGTPVDQSNISAFLQDEAIAHKQVEIDQETTRKIDQATQNDKAAKLHEQVEEREKKNADKEGQAAIKRAEQEKREQEIERDAQLRAAATLTGKAKQAAGAALAPAQSVADRIASAKTGPGGVGFLLIVIGILLFTVVQVNSSGDTRMKQLWYMLNGKTSLQGRKTLTKTPDLAQQAQQDFANIGTAAEQVISDLTGSPISSIISTVGSFVGVPLTDSSDFVDYRDLP